MDIQYERSTSVDQLKMILDLQQRNLPSQLQPEEIKSEGFVTVHHTLDLLIGMNQLCPHIIAKSNKDLAGYALCMHPVLADEIEVLKSMFHRVKKLLPKDCPYMVMGQVCVEKLYRKKGVFRGLYSYMRSELRNDYERIITEVDQQNIRSLNAHYAIGFEDLLVYKFSGRVWHLIQWQI